MGRNVASTTRIQEHLSGMNSVLDCVCPSATCHSRIIFLARAGGILPAPSCVNAATRAVRSHLFKLNHEPDPLEDLPSFLPLPQSLILRHELRRRGGLSKGRLDEEEGAGPGGDDAAGHRRLQAELRGRGMHVYSNI